MAKAYSEADSGSMRGYNPNLGLPKSKVANSGYTPKSGPMAPRATAKAAPKTLRGMRGAARRMSGAQGNAMSTQMTAGVRKGQSAFNRLLKR